MTKPGLNQRFGIGEWFGNAFPSLNPAGRKSLLGDARSSSSTQVCPFKVPSLHRETLCKKKGGVCSLLLYQQQEESGRVRIPREERTSLRVTCPSRFEEAGTVYSWIGETVLGDKTPAVVGEIGFLESLIEDDDSDVGRIDNILVTQQKAGLKWCALEMQAVYFSGQSMSKHFKEIEQYSGKSLPFPAHIRRPDYRSSGPKRLMPQLQIKVPALRRWGKKMAVVVDEMFFRSLGPMEKVPDISNCDIVWFVVAFERAGDKFKLKPKRTVNTTLERAVEGLTAGQPTTLAAFEERIKEKMARSAKATAEPSSSSPDQSEVPSS